MNCPEICLAGIDSAYYARLLADLAETSAKIDGNQVEAGGCSFDWNYDPAASTLNITCTRKPFYATCAEVESRIRELVLKAKDGI